MQNKRKQIETDLRRIKNFLDFPQGGIVFPICLQPFNLLLNQNLDVSQLIK